MQGGASGAPGWGGAARQGWGGGAGHCPAGTGIRALPAALGSDCCAAPGARAKGRAELTAGLALNQGQPDPPLGSASPPPGGIPELSCCCGWGRAAPSPQGPWGRCSVPDEPNLWSLSPESALSGALALSQMRGVDFCCLNSHSTCKCSSCDSVLVPSWQRRLPALLRYLNLTIPDYKP